MTQEQLTDRIEQIAKQVRHDFNLLVHEMDITDADTRWNVRVIIGERIGDALINAAPIVLADDDESLMVALRSHTTDQM